MKKALSSILVAGAMAGAMSSAQTTSIVRDTHFGLSNSKKQMDTPTAIAQTLSRTGYAKRHLPHINTIMLSKAGVSPKEYGQYLQSTGRQKWSKK